MRDMTRDELHDILPELLHGRLPAADAAAVERVVAADAELTAELALLRSVRDTLAPAPSMNVARIVAALPAPVTAAAMPVLDDLAQRRAAHRPVMSRAFARAAALLVIVGGGTMVSVWQGRSAPSVPISPVIAAESAASAGDALQLGLGISTDELSVEQLRAVEADIRSLDDVPSAEPDAGGELMSVEGA